MKLEGKRIGFALAGVTLAIWIVCSLSVAFFPGATMTMTAYLFHLNPAIMGMAPGKMMGWGMDLSSIAMGAICWTGFGFLPEAIKCKGQTRYVKVDSFTEVIISGELEIIGEKIPNLPRIIAHKVESTIENFVLKLISPNMTEANRGLEAYLAEQDKY